MKTSQDALYTILEQLSIPVQIHYHEPLFTVEQALAATHTLQGADVKNLFLKDDKKKLWLIVAVASTKIDLKKLSKAVQTSGLRFANADLLQQHLGVTPGSVTPLAIINDINQAVTVILDKNLFSHKQLKVHPLINTATVVISSEDLQKFITAREHTIRTIDFDTLL